MAGGIIYPHPPFVVCLGSYSFALLNQLFTLRHPSTPMMASPAYCVVLAMPKSTNHNTPFAAADMGSSACANDKM